MDHSRHTSKIVYNSTITNMETIGMIFEVTSNKFNM